MFWGWQTHFQSPWLPPGVCGKDNYQLVWRQRRSWGQKDICPFLSQICVTASETGGPGKKTERHGEDANCDKVWITQIKYGKARSLTTYMVSSGPQEQHSI